MVKKMPKMSKENEAYWRGYHNGYACAMEDNAKLTLVRCKDCKYFGMLDPEIYCYMLGANKTIKFSEDGYCSWGERRKEI